MERMIKLPSLDRMQGKVIAVDKIASSSILILVLLLWRIPHGLLFRNYYFVICCFSDRAS
jgi:hypothetical protein